VTAVWLTVRDALGPHRVFRDRSASRYFCRTCNQAFYVPPRGRTECPNDLLWSVPWPAR
jgi:hypothetical protein